MKKKLLLLITLVVSLFIYSCNAYASQVMYMECDDGFSDFLGVFTIGEGNAKFQIAQYKPNMSGAYAELYDKDKCWIREARFLDENCSDDEFGEIKDFDINIGMCPEKMRLEKYLTNKDMVFAGNLIVPKEISTLEKNEYVFFQRKSDGKIIAESYYSGNGTYSYINHKNYNKHYQTNRIINNYLYKETEKSYDKDFWKVAQDHVRSYAYYNCRNEEKNCIFETDYTVLFDSDNKKNELYNKINDWASENKVGEFNENYNKFLTIANDSNFVSAVDKMIDSYEKKESYNFSDGYTPNEMYNKLNNSYKYLKSIYDNPLGFRDYKNSGKYLSDAVESALQYTINEYFNVTSFEEYCKNDGNKCMNVSILNKVLYDDIKEYLNLQKGYSSDVTIFDLGNLGVLDDYTSKFLTAVAYLNKYSDSTGLSNDIIENGLPELKNNMADLGRTRDIYVVIDCDDLFSSELKEKINHYYNIFKILISLLLIVLGLLDFGKAVFESDDKKMKESQSKFLKRIVIVIILFLIPLFVKFILSIANAVWSNIYPGACGLF